MTGGQDGLPVAVHLPGRSLQVAVAANDFLFLRVPHDELLVAIVAGVELVEVERLACASTRLAEGDLTQTTNLLQHVGCIVSRDDIYLVVALVGHAELFVGRQFALQRLLVNGGNDRLFHLSSR